MADRTNRDGAEEREELLDELEENHQRARREAAGTPEPNERDAKKARDAKETDRDEANPPRTTTGFVTAPKFGSAGSGGAELEPGPKKN
ncbi:MAG: hypothetical protein ACT4PJ_09280 [Gemmatimonadaceae bacterium]